MIKSRTQGSSPNTTVGAVGPFDDTWVLVGAAALGAVALPALLGGGIGIAIGGSAFGISAETPAIVGAIGSAAGAHKITSKSDDKNN